MTTTPCISPGNEGQRRPRPTGHFFVRCERQCLLRLPVTQAVVFTIHTYVVRAETLTAEEHGGPDGSAALTRALIVVAHPLRRSLCWRLADLAAAQAQAAGWQVTVCDLNGGFDPKLSMSERASYYSGFHGEAAEEMAALAQADALILVFPTWWFGFPAVLKGWFDRVWAPGLAYDHDPAAGLMRPRLLGLRRGAGGYDDGCAGIGWTGW